jgi:hypothetical protein
MQRTPGKIIVAFVPRQLKIFQIWGSTIRIPIMIAQGRKEAILLTSSAVLAVIGRDIVAEKLADSLIDRIESPIGIIVIAQGDNEIGLPGMYQRSHIRFSRAC